MGFTGNTADDRAILGKLIIRLGLPVSVLSLVLAHAEAVRSATQRLGLVSHGDLGQVVSRHTADSLLFALARTPAHGERWLDVGSGAGFPGLVLACAYPESAFTLLEPLKKRAGFLEVTALELGLGNVVVRNERLADLEHQDFDVAVSRALEDPAETRVAMVDVVREGGEVLVAIGPSEAPEPPARLVALDGVGFVDSPGRFSMMTRGG